MDNYYTENIGAPILLFCVDSYETWANYIKFNVSNEISKIILRPSVDRTEFTLLPKCLLLRCSSNWNGNLKHWTINRSLGALSCFFSIFPFYLALSIVSISALTALFPKQCMGHYSLPKIPSLWKVNIGNDSRNRDIKTPNIRPTHIPLSGIRLFS